MNSKPINRLALSTLIAVLALMLPSFKALAFTPRVSSPASNLHKRQAQHPPQLLSLTNPLYVCWDLTYNEQGIVRESRLRMAGYEGVMATRYYSLKDKGTAFVGQTMKLHSSPRGLIIFGFNPIDLITKRPHPTYSPDNFALQVDPERGPLAFNINDAGRLSPVDVKPCRR
ncbi:hypothetical protein [Acaryochloris sp. IP29b_bin.148]|uniref:hypothetical protein n=1 Tax=Acaryochloris sp. IP29b_bin.148 TaxID=2969218 RepID=UPI00263A0E61|nr:hypothetical protein [Acaryochloris sp. IP29b_bin.148]